MPNKNQNNQNRGQKQLEPVWQQIAQSHELDGRPVIMLESVDSTNSYAINYAKKGAETGTVIIAQNQTGGRGRLGRVWQSPKGAGLYFSIIARPTLKLDDLSKITLCAGLALRNAVASVSGIKPLLKWPNDLLVNQKKMAGILTEADISGDGRPVVVIGIGLNVNTKAADFSEELAGVATSMYLTAGSFFDKGAILAAVLRQVDSQIERLAKDDFKGILADWRACDATHGKRLKWVSVSGEKITGVSMGPDEEGLLHIRDDLGKMHSVLSGDLAILPE